MVNKKAEASFIVAGVILFIVLIILIVTIAIPVVTKATEIANITGVTKQVIIYVPVFLALAGFIFAINLSGMKF